jgi:hypothetical protein
MASLPIAGHEVPFAVRRVAGRHELTIGDNTLYEGTNGRFVGGSHGSENPLREVIAGRLSAADYVAEIKCSVDVRFAVHALLGQPARQTCARLTRQARRLERQRRIRTLLGL